MNSPTSVRNWLPVQVWGEMQVSPHLQNWGAGREVPRRTGRRKQLKRGWPLSGMFEELLEKLPFPPPALFVGHGWRVSQEDTTVSSVLLAN